MPWHRPGSHGRSSFFATTASSSLSQESCSSVAGATATQEHNVHQPANQKKARNTSARPSDAPSTAASRSSCSASPSRRSSMSSSWMKGAGGRLRHRHKNPDNDNDNDNKDDAVPQPQPPPDKQQASSSSAAFEEMMIGCTSNSTLQTAMADTRHDSFYRASSSSSVGSVSQWSGLRERSSTLRQSNNKNKSHNENNKNHNNSKPCSGGGGGGSGGESVNAASAITTPSMETAAAANLSRIRPTLTDDTDDNKNKNPKTILIRQSLLEARRLMERIHSSSSHSTPQPQPPQGNMATQITTTSLTTNSDWPSVTPSRSMPQEESKEVDDHKGNDQDQHFKIIPKPPLSPPASTQHAAASPTSLSYMQSMSRTTQRSLIDRMETDDTEDDDDIFVGSRTAVPSPATSPAATPIRPQQRRVSFLTDDDNQDKNDKLQQTTTFQEVQQQQKSCYLNEPPLASLAATTATTTTAADAQQQLTQPMDMVRSPSQQAALNKLVETMRSASAARQLIHKMKKLLELQQEREKQLQAADQQEQQRQRRHQRDSSDDLGLSKSDDKQKPLQRELDSDFPSTLSRLLKPEQEDQRHGLQPPNHNGNQQLQQEYQMEQPPVFIDDLLQAMQKLAAARQALDELQSAKTKKQKNESTKTTASRATTSTNHSKQMTMSTNKISKTLGTVSIVQEETSEHLSASLVSVSCGGSTSDDISSLGDSASVALESILSTGRIVGDNDDEGDEFEDEDDILERKIQKNHHIRNRHNFIKTRSNSLYCNHKDNVDVDDEEYVLLNSMWLFMMEKWCLSYSSVKMLADAIEQNTAHCLPLDDDNITCLERSSLDDNTNTSCTALEDRRWRRLASLLFDAGGHEPLMITTAVTKAVPSSSSSSSRQQEQRKQQSEKHNGNNQQQPPLKILPRVVSVYPTGKRDTSEIEMIPRVAQQ